MGGALAAVIPDWFEMEDLRRGELIGRARVPGTVWREGGIVLRISLRREPIVSELLPGMVLPKQCPERHLFRNSTFCLALRTPIADSPETARDWWEALAQYLLCQSAAHQTGFWPLQNGLDHGTAGSHHAKVLSYAERLGIIEEYYAVHAGTELDFTAETLARLGGERMFRALIEAEDARQRSVANYRAAAASSLSLCCGTMRNCPFPKLFEIIPDNRDVNVSLRTWLSASVARGAIQRAY